ncbi:hypothetical protein VSX70_01620 [Lactiplantibacillus plantarum]|uniref:hypothetical protein n=1 Tax=Lactiplantibacillus plantarum TaxID=1590 RepID=UPI002E2E4605|nr:hypothetical protein [Lactiplantibacillus plantarum]
MLVFIVIGLITAVITIGLGYWSYILGKRNKSNLVGNLVITVIYVLLFVWGRQRFNRQKTK